MFETVGNIKATHFFREPLRFHMGVSKNRGKTPQNGWFIMETLLKMDDLGYPYFWKHPYIYMYTYIDIYQHLPFGVPIRDGELARSMYRKHLFGTQQWFLVTGYGPGVPSNIIVSWRKSRGQIEDRTKRSDVTKTAKTEMLVIFFFVKAGCLKGVACVFFCFNLFQLIPVDILCIFCFFVFQGGLPC